MILSSFSVVTSSVLTPLLASAVGVESEFYAKALAAAVALVTVVVFLFAQLFGELAIRLSLPAVLGELIAGFILGVSGIHCIVWGNGGEVADWTVAAVQLISGSDTTTIQEVFAGPIRILLNQYAELGVGVLLFKIGLEADLEELIKVGPQAASVAVAGVILPFVAGFVGLTSIFHLSAIASIFAAAALTATSIGITSRIMQEMGVLNSATLFVISAIVLNKVFGPRYINFLSRFSNPYSVLIGSIIFLSLMGTIANVIGLEEILGCFAAGIILGNTKATAALEKACEPLVALFATVFFVSIGAKTDLSVLNLANPESRTGLVIAAFLIVIAILGKLAAGYFVFSKENVNRLAIGTGMVPRGEVGLVFAGLGATTGTLTGSLNVAIVLMVIATTFVAPPMLRWVFASNQTVTNQEQQPVAK